jgi:hypothetical protein
MLHIVRKMRKNRGTVWTSRGKLALLCEVRYRICGGLHIRLRQSTHSSGICAKTAIFGDGVGGVQIHHLTKQQRNKCSFFFAIVQSNIQLSLSSYSYVHSAASHLCGFPQSKIHQLFPTHGMSLQHLPLP